MNLCDSCETRRNGGCKGNEPWAVIVNCPMYHKPPTNADRIRDMSDKELANMACEVGYCPPNAFAKDFNEEQFKTCQECWLNWLKSPANY